MADWPVSVQAAPPRGIINIFGLGQPLGSLSRDFAANPAAAAWPAANRALYLPFIVNDYPVLVTQGWWYMGVQAGNYDMGVYDDRGARLTSLGTTAVPANTNSIVLANFADITLQVGFYYIGLVMSTVTTLTVFRYTTNNTMMRLSGCAQEALGSNVLPNPATYVNALSNSYVPACGLLTDLAA